MHSLYTKFTLATKNLLLPSSRIGNTALSELHDYIQTVNKPLDNLLMMELSNILPPHNEEDMNLMFQIFECVVVLDNIKVFVTVQDVVNYLYRTLHIRNITPRQNSLINNMLINFSTIKKQYNITNSMVIVGYEINSNSVYFWKFT